MAIGFELIVEGSTQLLPDIKLTSEKLLDFFKIFGKILPFVALLAESIDEGITVVAQLKQAGDQSTAGKQGAFARAIPIFSFKIKFFN